MSIAQGLVLLLVGLVFIVRGLTMSMRADELIDRYFAPYGHLSPAVRKVLFLGIKRKGYTTSYRVVGVLLIGFGLFLIVAAITGVAAAR